ncbi:substrate-binding domain-containing protein [Aquibacillus saliphilus]|uniref:substrate-binding domain-containing protein n=1 Tax=Aquibacillus saliphilus TaxID=1909422 RepID=UPI001CEFC519|nr:substrate-binding domain-containing protein [Aquibacillus saliphilus]
MLRKKYLFIIVFLVVAIPVLILFLNSRSNGTEDDETKVNGKYRFGVSYENLESEYVQGLQEAIQEKVKELDVTIIEKDGRGKAENQVMQVENFIFDKVDAIILNPYEKDGTVLAVKKAKEANIPLILLSGEVENIEEATAYVGSADIVAGRMETELIVNVLGGKGNIVILHLQGGSSLQISRDAGIKNVLSQYPEIKIISEQTANGNREQAKYLMEKWLEKLPDIDAVISQNDAMALGAYDAIKGTSREDEIDIVGIDAIPEAVEAVKKGKLLGTIFQDSKQQGFMAIELALKAAKGEEIDHMNYIPFRIITKQSYIQ